MSTDTPFQPSASAANPTAAPFDRIAQLERELAEAKDRIKSLEAGRDGDFEIFHAIRLKLTEACGDPYKLHQEALDAIIAERDQLRAECEVERLHKMVADAQLSAKVALARVAELEADKARLIDAAHNAVDHVGAANYRERQEEAHEMIDDAARGKGATCATEPA